MALETLPHLNACLNTISSVLLISGLIFIKLKRRRAHAVCMLGAVFVSILFLISYLTYHYWHGTTAFTTQGVIRIIYFAVLLSHTALAAVTLLLVPVTLYQAIRSNFKRHKKIARWSYPIWLYVALTGVLIYLMLYHWFPPTGPGHSL